MIRNIYPGCGGRGCCNAVRQADNMQVTFPPGSDAAMRAVLLGAGVLAQYTFFSGRVRVRSEQPREAPEPRSIECRCCAPRCFFSRCTEPCLPAVSRRAACLFCALARRSSGCRCRSSRS